MRPGMKSLIEILGALEALHGQILNVPDAAQQKLEVFGVMVPRWAAAEGTSEADARSLMVEVVRRMAGLRSMVQKHTQRRREMKNATMMVAVLGVLLGLSGCKDDKRALSKGAIKDVWTQASDSEFLYTRGIGVAPEGARSQTHRRGLARNAALSSARYELLSIIKGLKMEGGLTIGALMQTKGEIREIANRVIAGAEEAQTEFTLDDGCVVLLRLERSKVEKILADTAPYDEQAGVASGLPGLEARNGARKP